MESELRERQSELANLMNQQHARFGIIGYKKDKVVVMILGEPRYLFNWVDIPKGYLLAERDGYTDICEPKLTYYGSHAAVDVLEGELSDSGSPSTAKGFASLYRDDIEE